MKTAFLLLLCSAAFGEVFLQKDVDKALQCIQHPHREWIIPKTTDKGDAILDVAIIGGGQTGLTMAFSLLRHNITNIRVFDKNKEGRAGSWVNIGRMQTLRTPKSTTGPDLDIPELSVQNWYAKKYGDAAWDELDYIPRLAWHDYLNWFRKVLKLPVEFDSDVGPLTWDHENQAYSFLVEREGRMKEVFARKVILAVGLEGSGEWMIPEFVRQNLPKERYAQATWKISPEQIKGKRVAILGAGPNAFDLSLEVNKMGAKKIDVFSKRDRLVTLHCFKWGEFAGFMKCFTDLSDKQKYNFAARMVEMGQPPVPERVEATFKLPNFQMHYDARWKNTRIENREVVIESAQGEHTADFLILATGWHCDLQRRPELVNLVDKIAKWGDMYTPPKSRRYKKLLEFPYLGRGFQFTPKNPKEDGYLNALFNMTGGGLVSNGFCAGTGITGMKYSINLITDEICRQFFLEDAAAYYRSFDEYNQKDFDESLYLTSCP